MAVELSWPQVPAYRLERQCLNPRAPAGTDPVDAVRRSNGLHAQLMSSVEHRMLDALGERDRVTPLDLEGTRTWMLTDRLPELAAAGPPIDAVRLGTFLEAEPHLTWAP